LVLRRKPEVSKWLNPVKRNNGRRCGNNWFNSRMKFALIRKKLMNIKQKRIALSTRLI